MENQFQDQGKKTAGIETQELDHWYKEFGISKEQIIEEVKNGGSATTAVEKIVKRTALVA